jgi:hypothetical protein
MKIVFILASSSPDYRWITFNACVGLVFQKCVQTLFRCVVNAIIVPIRIYVLKHEDLLESDGALLHTRFKVFKTTFTKIT